MEKGQKKRGVLLDVLILVFVVMLAFTASIVLREYVFIATEVSGSSMEPTLYGGAPKQDKVYILKTKNIKRGGIVMLKNPEIKYNSEGELIVEEEYLIKRVIAVEGDVLSFKLEIQEDGTEKGYLWLNGQKLDEPYLKEEGSTFYDNLTSLHGEYTVSVPEGRVFVMGDNRRVSKDSRLLGLIDVGGIRGKAFLVIRDSKLIFM